MVRASASRCAARRRRVAGQRVEPSYAGHETLIFDYDSSGPRNGTLSPISARLHLTGSCSSASSPSGRPPSSRDTAGWRAASTSRVHTAFGALLIGMGVLVFTNKLSLLANFQILNEVLL